MHLGHRTDILVRCNRQVDVYVCNRLHVWRRRVCHYLYFDSNGDSFVIFVLYLLGFRFADIEIISCC